MEEAIRIFITDDHAVVRQGLRGYLETEPGFTVVGEASTGEEAIARVPDLVPDVVLMDLVMPGCGGIEATREIRRLSPETKVIVLTSYTDEEMALPALKAGALSYLLKDVAPDDLVQAIKAARRGEAVLHPAVAAKLVQELSAPKGVADAGLGDLTPRETDVLKLIAQGYSNKEIGDKLFIGERTVKTHVSNILGKLHLGDRTQAAIYALRHKLVPLEGEPAE